MRAAEIDRLARAVGLRVRAARKRNGWTSDELAFRLGASRGGVQSLECGLHDSRMSTIYTVARVLGVEPAELLPTDDEIKTATPSEFRRRYNGG